MCGAQNTRHHPLNSHVIARILLITASPRPPCTRHRSRSSHHDVYRPHPLSVLTPTKTAVDGDTHHRCFRIHNNNNTINSTNAHVEKEEEEWSILDAPGLTPPRTQRPHATPLSPLLSALHSLASTLVPPLASTELIRRLSVTLCMLGLVRIGHYIPIPGLLHLPPSLPSSASTTTTGAVQSMTSSLTGSYELPGNIFVLSITPYMTAHFLLAILQLLPEVRSHIKTLRDQGRPGREVINGYVNTLFVVCAVLQAVVESGRLVAMAVVGSGAAALALWRVQAGVTLLAGAVICKYGVQMVDQYGLGDGTGMIIGAGIALAHAHYVTTTALPSLWAHPPALLPLILSLSLLVGLVLLVVYIQGIELRLPLTFYLPRRGSALGASSHPVLRFLSSFSSSNSSSSTIPGDPTPQNNNNNNNTMMMTFPLRLSPAGTRQLLFANFWVGTLSAPLQWLGLPPSLLHNPWAFALLVFTLEAVSIADATPKQAAEFLAQSDMGIRGLSPGIDTERFLAKRRRQMQMVNALFIAGVSLGARGVDGVCASMIGVPLGCLNVLLLVSTVLGGARQVDALGQGARVERIIEEEYRVLERAVV